MRKNNWWYPIKSDYSKRDFRSRLYSGIWQKHYINKVSQESLLQKKSYFKVASIFNEDKKEHLPKSLFKFFGPNIRSIMCLENQTICVTSPKYFNDPYDCYLGANKEEFIKTYFLNIVDEEDFVKREIITQDELQAIKDSVCYDTTSLIFNTKKEFSSEFFNIEMSKTDEIRKMLYDVKNNAEKVFDKKINDLRNNDIKVSCFSEMDEEDLSIHMEMWAHYADSHKGFCVEYDIEKLYNTFETYDYTEFEKSGILNHSIIKKIISGLLPCIYSSKMITISTFSLFKDLFGKKLSEKDECQRIKLLMKAFLTKSSKWSYEKEWRLILDANFCTMLDNAIPFPFIKNIYLGSRISSEYKDMIILIATKIGANVYTSSLKHDKFSLEFFPINVEHYFKEANWKKEIRILNSY